MPRVVAALAGRTVVGSAVCQRGGVERVDGVAVFRLKRQMMAAGQPALRGFAVARRNEQLVRPEESRTRTARRNPQDVEDGRIEPLRGGKIGDHELDVVDQAAAMEFLRLHGDSVLCP